MTAADRARQLAQRAEAARRAEAELVPPRVREVRTRPVRQTVDLEPERYDAFSAWLLESALALGWRRVTAQAALDAMVEAVTTDDVVARRVRAILEQSG